MYQQGLESFWGKDNGNSVANNINDTIYQI